MRANRSDRWRTGVVGVLVLSLSTACGGDDDGLAGPEPEAEGEVAAFVSAMNAHRVDEGCEPLAWRTDVAGVAESHSADMVDRGYFSHYSPEGDGPGERLGDAGVETQGWAENIAYGTGSGETVLGLWLDSPGHRSNIENCSLTHHGVGLVGTHWTHLFIRSD